MTVFHFRYKLYGIITHSGVSLTSGHYLSYVRSLPPSAQAAQGFLKPQRPVETLQGELMSRLDNDINQNAGGTSKSGTVTRKKAGVATKLPARYAEDVVTITKVKAFETVAKKTKVDFTEQIMPVKHSTADWFECDDETVRVFDESEFADLLSGKSGALLGTPYLLFYHKATLC